MAKAKKEKKVVKMADIRPMTDDQITKRLDDLAKEKMNLRFQKAAGQLQNPKAGQPLRKEVARLKTEQSARAKAAPAATKKAKAAPAKKKKSA
jgi:large subunit ribosomal protein L29